MELSNKKRKIDKTDNKHYARQKNPDRKEHRLLWAHLHEVQE